MTPKCGKCAGKMEQGFVIDNTYGANLQERWTEGKPEPFVWLGMNLGIKIEPKKLRPVATWRCTGCGYLESYVLK